MDLKFGKSLIINFGKVPFLNSPLLFYNCFPLEKFNLFQ